jgi:hypothetical protein
MFRQGEPRVRLLFRFGKGLFGRESRTGYGVVVNAELISMHDMKTPDAFLRPIGLHFSSVTGDAPDGCACFRKACEGIAELKRTKTQPGVRSIGFDYALTQAAARKMRQQGCTQCG